MKRGEVKRLTPKGCERIVAGDMMAISETTMHRTLRIATAAFAFLLPASCGGGPERVRVGVIVPLSGDTASYGKGVQRGIELAFAEAPALGLSNLELRVEDGRCEGRSATAAMNKLLSVDKVAAVVGEVCSGATLAIAPLAEKREVPLLSPSASSPDLSRAGNYVFRTIPSDALQGRFSASLLSKRGHRKIAILYPNEDYGLGFQKVLREAFTEGGGKVVASEAFERGAVDLRGQLLKIREASPDALFLICNSPDSALAALRQAKELGLSLPVYGSEGVKAKETAELSAATGLIVVSVSAGNSAFLEAFRARFHEEPGPFAAQGHDAMKALLLAFAKAGEKARGPGLQKALQEVRFDGASGRIAFDPNGDVDGNYETFVVKDRAFVPFKP